MHVTYRRHQQPAYAPPGMYDQPSFIYFGWTTDEVRVDRLGKIAVDRERIREAMHGLRRFEFAFVDVANEYMAIVKAPG